MVSGGINTQRPEKMDRRPNNAVCLGAWRPCQSLTRGRAHCRRNLWDTRRTVHCCWSASQQQHYLLFTIMIRNEEDHTRSEVHVVRARRHVSLRAEVQVSRGALFLERIQESSEVYC